MRPFVFVLLVACGGQPEKSQPPIALPTSPPASASAATTVAKHDDPISELQDMIPHWLDLLAHGEDEKFIDEVVVPEELDKVLGGRTKGELVSNFKTDKHDEVVKILVEAQKSKPDDVRQEGRRTYVKYEGRDGIRHVTFVVEGPHVWIHN